MEARLLFGAVERRSAGEMHSRSRLGKIALRLQTTHWHRSNDAPYFGFN